MSNLDINYSIPFFNNKKIIEQVILSNSFGSSCKKITFEDKSNCVLKELKTKKNKYDSIFYEGKSLEFMNKNWNLLLKNYITPVEIFFKNNKLQ